MNPELELILKTVPMEEVIAHIEKLDPPWKKDLVPWQITEPGEEIPWQAVFVLQRTPLTPEAIAWAERTIAEIRAMDDQQEA